MKLTKLIEQLKTELDAHGDLEVFVSADEEGNGFNPADFLDTYVVAKDDPDVYPVDDPDEYEKDELDAVVIIWP